MEFVRSLPYDHPFRWDATPVGGSKLWRPDELGADLALWLDAEDSSSITLNGGNVAQWSDKSGNTPPRNATQATAADQPTYTASGLNGKPVITFDGSDKGFVLASGLGVPRDMVSVSRGSGYLYSANTTTERLAYAAPAGSNLYWSSASGSPANISVPGRDGVSAFIEQYTAKDLDYEVFLNGASALSGTLSSSWTNDNVMDRIGLKWGATTGIPSWTGIIAEIVWTSDAMPLSDRQKLEGYLAWHWELEANLPVGHPYASTPPVISAGTGFNFTAWNFPFLRG